MLSTSQRARVPVPVPGAANAITLLVDARGEPEAAQPVQHVQAGKTRADNDDVVACCGRHLGLIRLHRGHQTALPRFNIMIVAGRILRMSRKRKRQ
jgi:hypothetical protein